jgi:7-cyano-7-deazaguanine synthase in queuosine biosynthesis
MATLLMFSGGLDSTAALYKLLTDDRDELRVHHLHMINRERRARAERDAAAAIIDWCRAHCRPFRYSESSIDFADLEAIPIDYVTIAYVACQVAIDTPGCDRIAVGTLAADLDEQKRKITASQRRVFDAMYACYRERKLGTDALQWIYPVYTMSKTEIVASLPEPLRAAAWSCRRPVATPEGYRICGECKPCRRRREVSAELNVPV